MLEPLQTLCGWPWVGPLETGVQETLFLSPVTLGISPIPTDSRLYCAPLNGAPDVPSSNTVMFMHYYV